MSNTDEYETILRRIEDMAGIDRTPRLLDKLNKLDFADHDSRLDILLDIGYKPADFRIWGNLRVFSQCEWTNLILGIEPMNPNIRFPNPDEFLTLLHTVDAWLVIHRLIDDQLKGAKTERTNPEVVKHDTGRIPNSSFEKSDLIAATSSVSVPIPCHLGNTTDISVGSQKNNPEWVFRKLSGDFWEIGTMQDCRKLKGVTAFLDMAYAIDAEGKDINPLDLPGSQSIEREHVNQSETTNREHTNSPEDDGPGWTGFGSDDVADSNYRHQIKKVLEKLKNDIEIAKETGDRSQEERARAELEDLQLYADQLTRPGGKSRKLTIGDPVVKATHAARDRKKTAISKINDANLPEVAKHLNDCYLVRNRSVTYMSGPPNPKWIK